MPENKETKYRHELKYQVTDAQIQMLKNRINHLLPLDSHVAKTGSYVIRSLYFDDYYDRCLQENENGTDPRENSESGSTTVLLRRSLWNVSARSGEKPIKPPAP